MRAVYYQGTESPDLEVDWAENGNLLDLTAATITLRVFSFNGPTLFTKTTGFAPAAPVNGVVPNPNLLVHWSGELDALDPGPYIAELTTDSGSRMFAELVVRFNAPNFGYCEIGDLEFGDISVPPSVNLYDYINRAADEINGEIGQLYALPLDLSKAPPWVPLKLAKINARIASGRYVASRAIVGEDNGLNAFASWLLKDGYADLAQIMKGVVGLTDVPRTPGSFRANAPIIRNGDERSPVTAFEAKVMGGHWFEHWEPGWSRGPVRNPGVDPGPDSQKDDPGDFQDDDITRRFWPGTQ